MKVMNYKSYLSGGLIVLAVPLTTRAQSPSTTQNFVVETIVKTMGKKNSAAVSALQVDSANRIINYFDGLGRPLQSVQWQGSPNKRDLVGFHVYDPLDREVKKYLPYADQSANSGSFKSDYLTQQEIFYSLGSWDTSVVKTQYPFSETIYENSPLNKVEQQGAPGAAWQPYSIDIANSGHTSRQVFTFNVSGEVPLWTLVAGGASNGGVTYTANTLYKTILRDENWVGGNTGTTEEFKDIEGRIVMKRVWETDLVSLSTHYIYDQQGNLRYVVPPAVTLPSFVETGDTNFANFIYGYHYDARKRMIKKKIPGKGWEHMVYNRLDQVVLSQNAEQCADGEWLFNKYDAFGRIIISGVYSDASTIDALQAALDSWQTNMLAIWEQRDNAGTFGTGYTNDAFPNTSISSYRIVNYYDDYSFYANSFGLPNGITEVSGIRTKGLATGTRVYTLGTTTSYLSVDYYDSEGRVVTSKSENHLGGSDIIANSYNFDGSIASSKRTHITVGINTIVENTFRYDHMGRKLGTTQKIDHLPNSGSPVYGAQIYLNKLNYNEIGQLKNKSLHSVDGTSFYQHTGFGYNERGWTKFQFSPQFSYGLRYHEALNGVVAQYNGNIANQVFVNGNGTKVFNYSYDGLKRLYKGEVSPTDMSEVLTFDVMGNIKSLNRNSTGPLTYDYKSLNNSNQLDFIAGLTVMSYLYDENGNVLRDGRNGVELTYNKLDLPATATGGLGNLTYTYDASGKKLKKTSSTDGVTDYLDGIQYKNGTIDFIGTEEGRAVKDINGNYKYEYNLKDHLGNVRYSFDIYNGAVRDLQRDDFYAFGMRASSVAGTNSYLYNGKELQHELAIPGQDGQYDYGARFYDPVIGRWNSIDPMAESMRRFSPYNYAFNNPIVFVDPDGMKPIWNGLHADEAAYTDDETGEVILAKDLTEHLSSDDYIDPKEKKKSVNTQPRGRDIIQAGDGGWSQRTFLSILKGDKKIQEAGVIAFGASKSGGATSYGRAFGAALVFLTAINNDMLRTKMNDEIDRIKSKTMGPDGMTYKLTVNNSGSYVDVRGNKVDLKAGDLWKYGETTGSNRYSNKELATMVPGGVSMIPISFGNQVQIKVQEKTLIYGHFFANGSLPPGNRIFR